MQPYIPAPVSSPSIHLSGHSIKVLHRRPRKKAKMAYYAERNTIALFKKINLLIIAKSFSSINISTCATCMSFSVGN